MEYIVGLTEARVMTAYTEGYKDRSEGKPDK